MRQLFSRYAELTVAQKRLYSLLIAITLLAFLLYCLGISSFLIRSRLVHPVAVQDLPEFTPIATSSSSSGELPAQTLTPTATLPPTPTQRPIPTYTPTPSPTATPATITMTVVITSTPGMTITVVISATVTPTPVLTPTATITAEESLTMTLETEPTASATSISLLPSGSRRETSAEVQTRSYIASLGRSLSRVWSPRMGHASSTAGVAVAVVGPSGMRTERLKRQSG